MRANLKVLLILELIVCFAPAATWLLVGLAIVPMSVAMEPTIGSLNALAMVIGGASGIVGISVVVAALMSGTKPRLPTWAILLLAAMGFASLLPLVVEPLPWRLYGLLPILAGLHVIYSARSLLFRREAPARGNDDDV